MMALKILKFVLLPLHALRYPVVNLIQNREFDDVFGNYMFVTLEVQTSWSSLTHQIHYAECSFLKGFLYTGGIMKRPKKHVRDDFVM